MMNVIRLFSATLLLLLVVGCSRVSDITLTGPNGTVVTVPVEIADEPEERETGLMNRDDLAPGTGMLFVFPEPQMLRFWMKNTRISLEILYFDAEGMFVNVLSMEPCDEDPCSEYNSAALAQYALEVNPGFRDEHGIGLGWRLMLP